MANIGETSCCLLLFVPSPSAQLRLKSFMITVKDAIKKKYIWKKFIDSFDSCMSAGLLTQYTYTEDIFYSVWDWPTLHCCTWSFFIKSFSKFDKLVCFELNSIDNLITKQLLWIYFSLNQKPDDCPASMKLEVKTNTPAHLNPTRSDNLNTQVCT